VNVGDVTRKIEERLPCAWSEDWDNVGLIIGDREKPVTKIAVALDATEGTVRDALARGCEMLVTHHPAIFRPINRIVERSPLSRMLSEAIKGGLAVYSSHTNWDSSPEGVNVILSRQIGLRGAGPIMPPHDGAWGLGAIGDLPEPSTLIALARAAKEAWNLSSLLVYGDDETPLSRVALCGGAGGDLLQGAIDRGADVYITADVSYHYLLHAQLTKTHLIVVNHGEMERSSLPNLCGLIREVTGFPSENVSLLAGNNWTPLVI